MTQPKVDDITIRQGSQYVGSVNWYGGGKVIQEIEGLTPGCPTSILITAHGLPSASATPIYVSGVKGARSANTGDTCEDMVEATQVDADNFTIEAHTRNQVYRTGTGCITWYLPKNLVGWSARMHIREKIDDTDFLVELTSANGDIVISTPDARTVFTIATAVTTLLDFTQAVYDLELVNPSDEATRIVEGKVFLEREVTR
jgi:hypothetical protein